MKVHRLRRASVKFYCGGDLRRSPDSRIAEDINEVTCIPCFIANVGECIQTLAVTNLVGPEMVTAELCEELRGSQPRKRKAVQPLTARPIRL
jgi:hypothetical protein